MNRSAGKKKSTFFEYSESSYREASMCVCIGNSERVAAAFDVTLEITEGSKADSVLTLYTRHVSM